MPGPKDGKAAFVRNGIMTVLDGRANVWTYDPSIKTDAGGNRITAPLDFVNAVATQNAILVVDSTGAMWIYTFAIGAWVKGNSIDDKLPGEVEKTTEPWKRGYNAARK